MKLKLRYFGVLLLLSVITLFAERTHAQLPSCGADVPFFEVDLTGDPDGFWESPAHIRKDNCCGTTKPDRCTSFEVTLDPNAAMINLEIVSGAVPPGALFYQIDCGTPIPVGDPICISGVGPHRVTFCKPGNNENVYRVSSIAKPTFPTDITTRVGCTAPFNIYGLEGITINSINASNGNTTPGAYNSLLDCIDCANPTFTPGISTPDWIDYEICGGPLASICGYVPVCDTVRIYTLDELTVGVTPDPAFFCASGTGVVLNSSPSGGDGAYSYSWTDGSGTVVSSTANYNATTEETFTVEVSDGLNSPTCPSSYFSIPVTVGQPPVVNAGADITACAEDPTVFLAGSVDNATGGVWSGGSGTFNPDANTLLTAYTPSTAELTAGTVTLTLTSTGAGGGCTDDSDDITINLIDTVKVNPTFSPIVCSGGTTTINANATGGSGTYTYIWSNGATTPSINVSAGTYSVMVQDDEGCAKGTAVTVNNPSPIVLSTSSNPTSDNNPLTCDGDATVVIAGGVAPYTIEWDGNPALNTATVNGLCYGVHDVSVTDANGCTVTTSVVVNNPLCSGFNASIINQKNVSCYGDTDGSAEAQVVGGTSPYNYSWNSAPVQTTAIANNLVAGTYDVTVTDDNGCQVIETVTITQPQIITNTITSSDATTIGGSDGSATANPQGGTSPFNYSWVPGAQTTQTATNLSEGTYYVTIVDDNGCIKLDSVLINQPPCNDFTLAVDDTDVNCNGANDGSASVLIAHGTPPYSIDWIDGSASTFATGVTSVSGLSPDSYTVQVEDQSNCITFTTFDITEPDALSIGLDATNISCNGSADGTIDLTVSGGTYPYSYQWYLGIKPISNTQDIVNLIPGTYSVTVTDANGCSTTESIGITQPAPLKLVVDVTDISCAGADDGSLEATALGGTLPYGYFWSGPGGFVATTQNISGLSDGLYEVQVVDGNGCSLSTLEQAYIDEPDTVSIDSVSIDCPAPGASVTNLEVITINGGDLGPYSVSFDNGGTFQTAGDYSASLSIGSSYTLIAEDGSGCQSPIPFVVDVNSSVVIDSVVFNPCIPAGATTIPVTVYPNGGANTDYSVSLDGGSTFQTAGTYTFNLNVGQDYDIVVKDEDDCASLPTSITLPNELLASATLASEVSCIGESDGSVTLSVSGGTTAYSYSWTGPSGFTAATQNISGLIEGTYDVDVTDQNGCVVSESIVVTTFPDATDPVVSCPTNISVSNDLGDCGAVVNYIVPVGTDNCPGATTTLTNGLTSGVQFPIGTMTVEYTVTDLAGNIATCSFDVEVIDDELPTITCPADVNETADLGVCEADAAGVTLGTPTTNDNCAVATVSNDAPLSFPVGNTVVTWTVTDVNGNVATCAQNVTVADVEAPIISDCGVSGSQTVSPDPGVCTYTNTGAGWDVTATDNCTTITVDYALTGATTGAGTTLDGVTFNNGTTTVEWTVTDAAGNASTCTYDIVVEDNELPIISDCGVTGSQTVSTDLGTCTYTNTGAGWDVTATDNCTISSVGYTLTGATTGTGTTLDGVTFNNGTTTVEWTVTDAAGNASTCTYDIVVEDNELPIISDCGVTGSQTVSTDLGTCTYTNTGSGWDVTATDNCTTTTVDYVLTGATTGTGTTLDGVTFNNGTTTVEWTVTDAAGNASSCTYDIVVEDNELPIIFDCGVTGSQTVSTDLGTCTYTNTGSGWDVTATDNCTTTTVDYVLTGATTGTGTTLDGVTFNNGTTTVEWTVTDAAGNASICTYDIVVEDNELPIISDCGVTGSQTVSTDLGTCTYTNTGAGWDVTATDNCTTITVGYTLTGATTGTGTTLDGVTFNNGTTTVEWTVTDAAGNASTCTYDIVVEDNELPIISDCGVSGSQTVVADAGVCTYTNTGTGWDVTATDNCTTITVDYALTGATTGTGTTLDGVTFNNGTTTVEWTVTDAAGNVSTCTYDIEVIDDQLPTITGCPSNVNATNDAGICGATVTWTAPTADDNCGVTSFTSTHNSGDVFPVGTTTVTYTATDDAGNVTTCSFTITISDNENPVINLCPSDITVSNDAGTCGAVVTWAIPTASDNCGVDSFTSTHNSGDVFNVGTTTVTYTAVDAAGNSITCSFDVIVEDNENPTILCQPDVSVDADPGVCEADASGVNLGTPVTGDNCGVATVTNDAPASYPVGTTVVTWTVTDVHGNTATCTQNVDVEDTQAPIISDCGVSGSQTVVADAGVCTYTNTGTGWDVVATDNCTTITIDYELTGATTGTGSTLDGVAFNNGTTTVTWTVTDDAGNTSVCSYDITVNDEEAPAVVDCPTPITVGTDVNDCGALVTWTPPTFTDNCVTVNVVSTHNPGDYFAVGTTTVTYTGTDAAGNETQCTFDVIVNDTELPTIACPSDIETCDSIVTYAAPTTDDNCGVANVTMIAGLASGSDFPVGTTTVTYEVEDIHGNTSQCSFDVTVFPLPEADIIATDVSCNGLGDGALDLTVTNGTSPYSFVWSNGSTDEDLTGLVPGTYDVVITDDNGCTTADTASIAEPTLLEVSSSVEDVLCNGGNDGSIDLTVTGGLAPYTYNWSNGSTDEDLTGLTIGTYDVTVTDDNGCTVQSSIDVEEPDTIQVTYTSTPATCEAPNGTITIDVVGGTAPYTYSWSNGETTADLETAVAGSYELTLTDDNGCTFVLQAEVESVSNLNASVSSTNVTCFERDNGTATVLVNTGNGPYTYNWSNGDTTAMVQGLAAGNYDVTVTDNFGCQVSLAIQISQPDPIEIDLFSPDLGGGYNVKPYDATNGSIETEVTGGTAPYNFNWSTGDTTQNLTGLPAGTYNVVVTDENGCAANASIILEQPMTLEMPEGFSPNNDGDNDYFVVRGIDAYESNEIKVFNRWGNIVYQKNNYDNTWDGTNNSGDELPDATYFVIVVVDTADGAITLKGYVDLRRKY